MRGVVALRELEGKVEFRSEELTAVVVAVKQVEELVNNGMSDENENGDSERERWRHQPKKNGVSVRILLTEKERSRQYSSTLF
ncbi:hypothetical protein TSUD_229680 [Trifolium subterraneum]|uniref:Uncharacterized protein n=1 Tax=Trifolium subterraneum TaxID=3900 RepID=A0A2Z6LGG7_TRISU|nr:hypothetical protein TSUD_229680 [Trifolium subterraneum]